MSSIDKRGVRDWWLQRLSAWLILLYVPVLMVWICAIQRPSSYQEWAVLFSPIVMKILATLALLGSWFMLPLVSGWWPQITLNVTVREGSHDINACDYGFSASAGHNVMDGVV